MCIKPDKERDARFFNPLRAIGVSNTELSIGLGYHFNGYFLSETMLVGNPILREIRSTSTWNEACAALEKTRSNSPERFWAIAKCADVFDWKS